MSRKREEIPKAEITNPQIDKILEKQKKGTMQTPIQGHTQGQKVKLSKVVDADTYIPNGKYKGIRIKVTLPKELYQRLKEYSQLNGVKMSEVIRVAVSQFLSGFR